MAVSFSLSGSVSEYGEAERSSIQAVVASAAGVDASAVTLEIVAASISVTATIAVASASAASATLSTLEEGVMSSASALEMALISGGLSGSLQVTSAPAVSLSIPAEENGGMEADTDGVALLAVAIGASVGGALVLIIIVVVCLRHYKRRRQTIHASAATLPTRAAERVFTEMTNEMPNAALALSSANSLDPVIKPSPGPGLLHPNHLAA